MDTEHGRDGDTVKGPVRAGASGFEPLEVNSPMAKWKKPQPIDFIERATRNYSFPNWQSGNEESIYYNLNIPEFFKCSYIAPPKEFSKLERAIDPSLLDLTFTASDGTTTPPLKEYLVGKRQVQAMMMAHKGKVVFETYPGMYPSDTHVWMSASKTTVSLTATMLWEDGKLDFDTPITTYIPWLTGTTWDSITVKNVMNMSAGLDIEETFESLTNPETFIAGFMTKMFEEGRGSWREWVKSAKPLPNEKPGDMFRYSSSLTMLLVVMVENITQMPWQEFWKQRVWSKIGAKDPFMVGLAPDGTPGAAGMNITTPEDMLRYAMIYTPTWNKVAREKIVSDKQMKCIQTLGNPKAYKGSGEEAYGERWFGETPYTNTAQWDHSFEDGAMFKHGNMGQGIYVDPERDFCGQYFGLATNDEAISGTDHSPGYLRAAAKLLAGG